MESRSKKFFYNTLFTALLQVVNVAAALIVPRFMLAFYGSEINGLVTSITQFINYFNLVEAGLSAAAIYALYKPLADGDERHTSEIVSASRRFYTQAGWVFTALTVLLSLLYPLYIDAPALSYLETALLVLVLGAGGFLEFFTLAKYRVLLTADQKTYVISIASILQVGLQTAIIAVLSALGASVLVARAAAIAALLLRSALLLLYCRRRYPRVDYYAAPDMHALDKRWDAMFLQVLGAIHQGTTVLLLTLVSRDLALVSIFSVFNIVVMGLNSVLGIFNSGLAASFGEVIAKNEKEVLCKAYREFESGFYMLISFVFAVSFVMIMPFVDLYTANIQDANYHQPIIGFLVVLGTYLYHLKTPQGMLVISAGMYRETRWRTLTQGAIALVGGAVLAVPFGLVGILVAAAASNLYRDVDLWFFSARRITGTPVRDTLLAVARSVVAVVISVLPFHFVDMTVSGWLAWVGYACLASLWAGLVTLILALLFDRATLWGILGRVKTILRRGG
ncbi:MAG: hypothetical protein IJ009_00860 [Clostridia bacterium]|nr:hypothetical protein [Clostridia bacterium]